MKTKPIYLHYMQAKIPAESRLLALYTMLVRLEWLISCLFKHVFQLYRMTNVKSPLMDCAHIVLHLFCALQLYSFFLRVY
jgi:hypothetical protein